MNHPLLVSAEGAPVELGRAIGAATAERVALTWALYERRFRDQVGLRPKDALWWGRMFLETTRAFAPRIAEEMEGLAEGADVAPEVVGALNGRTELLAARPPATDDGCTSIGIEAARSSTGAVLVAQTWDWNVELKDPTILLATRDEREHVILTLAEPGMLGKSGLSSARVAVSLNMLSTNCDRPRPAVPIHVLLRSVLEAPRFSSAIRSVLAAPRAASANVLVAGAEVSGRAGEILDLELHPKGFAVVKPNAGVVTHANHFQSALPPGMCDTRAALSTLSLVRDRRAARLLGHAQVGVEDLERVLADHFSDPDGICRHPDANVVPHERVMSCYRLVLEPGAGQMHITEGPPCEHTSRTVRISDPFPEP